ncbi:MAG TPA: phospho-sugar mutase, partial [Acidimicrobiia bacterium]|nr:phospho-sugar mutase [Acidimicrobiia bacterium]
ADPDPVTRAELEALLASGDETELLERMAGVLEFGTAGIRGAVGAGSNRMNRAVVIRTTRGLADFLADAGRSNGTVVLGFDGRLSSRRFAADAIGVLAAAGIDVRYFPEPAPTPLVAHAARRLEAVAAVVVTASHNPRQDNGYKVYDANGAQIVPPVDTRIASAIEAVGPANEVPRLDLADSGAVPIGEVAVADYVEEVITRRAATRRRPDLRIVYTPMHGVGRSVLERVFHAAGYRGLTAVPEQADPDGRFPTVAFPNPEEPGALDLATALAVEVGADLVLANDPDADRLAVQVPDGDAYRTLTGNQIGVLLADFVLEHDTGGGALVVNSIVSSPMLAEVARHHGARFEQTLTGFKWIANAAMDLQRDEGLRFVFGYEEALGYTVGPTVRDKDGISAALWFADLTAAGLEEGTGVLGRMERLYRRHGIWVSVQKSLVRPGGQGIAEIAAAMEALRLRTPDRLGGHDVVGVTDYREGAGDRPRWLPAAALVAFDLGEAGRALVRPSGTEPKLKIYADRRADIGEAADVWAAEAAARRDGMAVADDLAAFLGLA